MSTAGTVGEADGGFTPLSVEEARALMSEAAPVVNREALLAERAEAEAQLRAAEATLEGGPANGDGRGHAEQEWEEPAQKPHNVEVQRGSVVEFDVESVRAAAARAHQADDAVAQAASEASERPPALDSELGPAESAFTRVLEIREELPATWRRLVGALISATGMAIVVGALGWSVYWLLVPIALILIMTVDLRLAGKTLREASAEASQELASVGGVGKDELDRIRTHRSRMEEAEARLAAAREEREAAYALFEELAPGRMPSELDEIISEYEAARAARAEAEAEPDPEPFEADPEPVEVEAEPVEVEVEAEPVEAEVEAEPVEAEAERAEGALTEAADHEPVVEPEEPEAAPEAAVSEPAAAEPAAAEPAVEPSEPVRETAPAVTASEWWFGRSDAPEAPAAAAAPVRALAERLSAEGRDALARIQAQLDALDRVELAKKSLEWHEANGSVSADGSEEPAAERPEQKA